MQRRSHLIPMRSHHMDMGPHMKMTTLREAKAGDEDRAHEVVEAARNAAEKYQDYKVALADGYKFFCPIFRKSNITSLITGTDSTRQEFQTLSVQRRCCTKNRATITS